MLFFFLPGTESVIICVLNLCIIFLLHTRISFYGGSNKKKENK